MSLYWKCQLGGWGGLVIWNATFFGVVGIFTWDVVWASTASAILGLLLTHLSRRVIHRGAWVELPVVRLVPRVLIASALIGAVVAAGASPFWAPLYAPDARWLATTASNAIQSSFTILLWYLIYFWYQSFRRNREARESEKALHAAMRENELRTLRAQLNPHFLFNSLNNLRALIPECPERAQEAVTSLAGLLRHTLRLSRLPLIRLDEELEAARHYLALEKIRFEERLEVRIRVPPELLDQAMPPMLLQNLIENALKHGIAQRRAGGMVTVEAWEDGGVVHLEVTNPGGLSAGGEVEDAPARSTDDGPTSLKRHPGTRPERPTEGDPLPDSGEPAGIGLAVAREQLRILFGDDASLELAPLGPDRVVCRVLLPRRVREPALVRAHETESRPGAAPARAPDGAPTRAAEPTGTPA